MMAAAASSTEGGTTGGEIIGLKGGDDRGTGCERDEFCMMRTGKQGGGIVVSDNHLLPLSVLEEKGAPAAVTPRAVKII